MTIETLFDGIAKYQNASYEKTDEGKQLLVVLILQKPGNVMGIWDNDKEVRRKKRLEQPCVVAIFGWGSVFGRQTVT